MFHFIGLCLGMLVRLFRARQSLLLQNLALRQQLVALKRRYPLPSLGLSPRTIELTEAGALPCANRAFMNQIEALGVSFEREADSPILLETIETQAGNGMLRMNSRAPCKTGALPSELHAQVQLYDFNRFFVRATTAASR